MLSEPLGFEAVYRTEFLSMSFEKMRVLLDSDFFCLLLISDVLKNSC